MELRASNKLITVECIRGLASLAVCLFHFSKSNIVFNGSSIIYPTLTKYGWLGVEAFFVLSGFILPYAMINAGYAIHDFGKFLLKRIVRIEPPYIASIIVVIFLFFLSSSTSAYNGDPFILNWSQIFLHVGYLPTHFGYKWLNDVYWSLEAEFHFYILIGIWLPFILKNKWFCYSTLIFMLIASIKIDLLVFSYMPYFISGIVGALYWFKKISTYEYWTVLAVCFGVCVFRMQPIYMPFVALITSLILVNVKIESKFLSFLGKISFSLYLLHIPVGGKFINLLGRYADQGWQTWIILFLALGLCICVSWIFYQMIEQPFQKLSRRFQYKK